MEPLVAVVLALAFTWFLLVVALWYLRPRDVGLREIVRLGPDLLRLVRSLLTDAAAPTSVRLALAVLLVWLISPIDLIPEFIPVVGPLDDAIVAVVVLRYVRRRLGEVELRARWAGTPAGWELLTRLIGGAH